MRVYKPVEHKKFVHMVREGEMEREDKPKTSCGLAAKVTRHSIYDGEAEYRLPNTHVWKLVTCQSCLKRKPK